MRSVINRRRLVDALMVLTMVVLADCAGKHQIAMQDAKTPASAQDASATQSLSDDGAARASESIALEKSSVLEKKWHFFGMLRPIVDSENAAIMEVRHRLVHLEKKRGLDASDRDELQQIAAEYKVAVPERLNNAFWSTMFKRVDIIPMELVLAQAANESAWGTSRFAQEGNNFFGEWCFSKGCGIVPARRDDGAIHEVEAFDSPRDSVHSYMHNLNTLQAYTNLRKLRYHLREQHKPLNARLLAMGLAQYSERGQAYVKSIRTFIRVNREAMHTAPPIEAQNQTAMGALIASSH
jgi:Bax protein